MNAVATVRQLDASATEPIAALVKRSSAAIRDALRGSKGFSGLLGLLLSRGEDSLFVAADAFVRVQAFEKNSAAET